MIPQAYKEKMYKFMGDKSHAYIDELDVNLSELTEKWQLTNLNMMALSYNLVCEAHSSLYGEVVLKLCLPGFEYKTELHALEELNHKYMVELITHDENRRALLLKNLKPGETLWTVPYKERLKIAAPIINEMPRAIYKNIFPTVIGFVEKMIKYIKERYPTHEILSHLIYLHDKFDTLNVSKNPISLLHGDLHHWNILLSEKWMVIDPKGVIGYKSLEVGRYMNNQIQEDGIDQLQCMADMVDVFSTELGLSKDIIRLSFYADMVLSTSWNFEDHIVDHDNINEKVEIIKLIRNAL